MTTDQAARVLVSQVARQITAILTDSEIRRLFGQNVPELARAATLFEMLGYNRAGEVIRSCISQEVLPNGSVRS